MMALIILSSAVILSLPLLSTICAKSSDMFLDDLSDMIWTDCQGNNIHINQPVLKRISTNQTFDLLPWPYTRKDVRTIIGLLDDKVHFAFFAGTCENKALTVDTGVDGCSILTCQDDRLDVNRDTYYWKGTKVDASKDELKITSGNNSPIIETQGEKSPVTTGVNSPITQQEYSFQIVLAAGIIGAVIGLLLKVLYDLSRRKKHL